MASTTNPRLLTASVATLIERNDPDFTARLREWIDSGKSKRQSAVWSVSGLAVMTSQGTQVGFKSLKDASHFAAICRRCATLSWAIHEYVAGPSVLTLRARVFIPGGVINVG